MKAEDYGEDGVDVDGNGGKKAEEEREKREDK